VNHEQPAVNPGKRKTGILGLALRVFTVFIAIVTLIAGWVAMFNPAKFWFLAVTGLGFPFLFTINFILFIFWMLRRRMIAILPLAVFLMTLVKIPNVFQLHLNNSKPDFVEGQSPEIKVMSYNVRLFDLYNWSHNLQTRLKIFDFFSNEQPAILCLQEFYTDDKEFNNVKELKEILRAGNLHVEYPITLNKTEHWGIATYSIYPIVGKGVITFDQKSANVCIYTDIKINDDSLRVYNCHLQSVKLGNKEYQFIENFGQEEPETVERTRYIVTRLKKAFIKRARQSDLIAAHISSCPYPVILCGDFNDTPLSYTYNTISQNLTDAWRESGNGVGATYLGPIPGLRIDYIFHNNKVVSYNYNTHSIRLSDHDPISATIIIKP
jgi:endonuclease/exonuclease/phosphatase family metal-dependent hydrolase